jgi:hypothetical protein
MTASCLISSAVKRRCPRSSRWPSAAHTVEAFCQPISPASLAWLHPLRRRSVRRFAPAMADCPSGISSTRRRRPGVTLPHSFTSTAKTAFPPSSGCQPQCADSASTIRRPRPRSLPAGAARMAGPSGEGVRHDDGHCFRVPDAREGHPDRCRGVAAGVLYRVGDQLGRDHLSVVGVFAQAVGAERGPDVETCRGHRFRDARQHE